MDYIIFESEYFLLRPNILIANKIANIFTIYESDTNALIVIWSLLLATPIWCKMSFHAGKIVYKNSLDGVLQIVQDR